MAAEGSSHPLRPRPVHMPTILAPKDPSRLPRFVQSVLQANEEDAPNLVNYFISPKHTEVEDVPLNISETYAGVPEPLKRRTLLEHAETYHAAKSSYTPSRFFVHFFTVIFLIPATIMYILSNLWHRVILRDANKGVSSSSRSNRTTQVIDPETGEPKPQTASPVESSTSLPSRTPGKPYQYSSPWAVSRSWALWVVYIPSTRYQGVGGIKGAILPSKSPKFLNDHAAALLKGRELEANAQLELERTRRLWKRAVMQRREELEILDRILNLPPSPENEHRYEEALKKYQARSKTATKLELALHAAQKEVLHVREVAKTETCAQATGYLGVAHWAQDAHDSYSNLLNAVSGVCFVGAGLTYSAIFSATRGSIGLMAWAFSLFIVGLAMVITIQSLLLWCSRLDNYPFSTPAVWELFLGLGVYGACAAVVTAIAILVVTVFSLQFNVSSDPYVNPNAANWDAHLIFDVDPKWAATAAFSFVGVGVIVAILVFFFFSISNSLKLLLYRRSIERRKKPRVRLEDLV